MKKICLYLLLISLQLHSQNHSKKRSALFIGNSYTYFNNLPQMVEQLALANGDTLVLDSYAPGGYTFNNHFNDANCKTKIYSKDWDYVILQAQSQEPSFSPAQVNAQTLPYALKLDSLIKDNYACSETVFYETWGRKFGDASNCAAYPPVCTYTGMQNRLKQSYKLFADLSSGILAPAGEAFRESILQNPALELYQVDQSHPSVEGSYLTACVFYETLFQKSVLSNTYAASLTSTNAVFLQGVAHKVVADSLNLWNLGVYLPWANFTYTASNISSFQFQSFSGSLNTLWYFGDGSITSGAAPLHTYSLSGNYTVSHVVEDNCSKDSVSKTITVSLPVGISENNEPGLWSMHPNPAIDRLYFNGEEAFCVEVFALTGELVKKETLTNELSVAELQPGLYLLKIENKGQFVYRHLIVSRQ